MNYLREYSLTVGRPAVTKFLSEQYTEESILGQVQIPVAQDFRTETLNAVEIKNLQMITKIGQKTGGGSSASCSIDIVNLSEENRELVSKTNNYVILKAGYKNQELPMIFSGQVIDGYSKRVGTEIITTLVCSDGYIPNNNLRITKTYPRNSTATTVINDIIKVYQKNGIALGSFVQTASVKERTNYVQIDSLNDIIYKNGYSVTGYLVDVLTSLCKGVGYTNYIANGKLYIHPVGYTKQVEVFDYNPDQMYSVYNSTAATTSPSGKEDIGLEVTVQLDGRLGVDKHVRITSGKYAGTYKITKLSHTLNFEDSPWETTFTCRKLNVA